MSPGRRTAIRLRRECAGARTTRPAKARAAYTTRTRARENRPGEIDAGCPARADSGGACVVGLARSQSERRFEDGRKWSSSRTGDTEECRRAIHRLRSTARNAGARAVSALSQRTSRDGIRGAADAADPAFRPALGHGGRRGFRGYFFESGTRASAIACPRRVGSIAGRFAALGVSASRRPVRLVRRSVTRYVSVSRPIKLVEVLVELRAAGHRRRAALPEVGGSRFGRRHPGAEIGSAPRDSRAASWRPQAGQRIVNDELHPRVASERWRTRRRGAMRA